MDEYAATLAAALAERAGDVFDERASVVRVNVNEAFGEASVLVDFGVMGLKKYTCTLSEAQALVDGYGEVSEPVEPDDTEPAEIETLDPVGGDVLDGVLVDETPSDLQPDSPAGEQQPENE